MVDNHVKQGRLDKTDKGALIYLYYVIMYQLLKTYPIYNEVMGELKGMVEDLRKEVQVLVDYQQVVAK
jgi:hypothetical protein